MKPETISTIVGDLPLPTPVPVLTYSVHETAQVLGVAPTTVYRLIYRNILRPLPGIRHKRISKAQVHRYAEGAQP
jgi:excisionase family DNA binding protein